MDFLRNKPNYAGAAASATAKKSFLGLGNVLGNKPDYAGQGTGRLGDMFPPVTIEVPCPALAVSEPSARPNASAPPPGPRGTVPVSVNAPSGAKNFTVLTGPTYGAPALTPAATNGGTASGAQQFKPVVAQVVGLRGPSFGTVSGSQLTLTVEWMLLPDSESAVAGDNKAALTVMFY